MINTLGYIGGLLLGACAIPQAVSCIRLGHCRGISVAFLAMWTAGEVCQLAYSASLGAVPIVLNCVLNLVCLALIIYYRAK